MSEGREGYCWYCGYDAACWLWAAHFGYWKLFQNSASVVWGSIQSAKIVCAKGNSTTAVAGIDGNLKRPKDCARVAGVAVATMLRAGCGQPHFAFWKL